jgi:hypothetical protein
LLKKNNNKTYSYLALFLGKARFYWIWNFVAANLCKFLNFHITWYYFLNYSSYDYIVFCFLFNSPFLFLMSITLIFVISLLNIQHNFICIVSSEAGWYIVMDSVNVLVLSVELLLSTSWVIHVYHDKNKLHFDELSW